MIEIYHPRIEDLKMSKMHTELAILAYAYMEICSWTDIRGRHSLIRRTVDYSKIVWC